MNRSGGLIVSIMVVLATAGYPAGAGPAAGQDAERFDILIVGGRVFDGSGNPWFRADLGVRDGKITRIGDLPRGSARRVIDAMGKVVAPGFINLHSHADTSLLVDGTARSDIR